MKNCRICGRAISRSKLRITERFKRRGCRNRPQPSPRSSSSLYGLRRGPSLRFIRGSGSRSADQSLVRMKTSTIAYSFQHFTPSVNNLQGLSITSTYSQQLSPIMAGLSFFLMGDFRLHDLATAVSESKRCGGRCCCNFSTSAGLRGRRQARFCPAPVDRSPAVTPERSYSDHTRRAQRTTGTCPQADERQRA